MLSILTLRDVCLGWKAPAVVVLKAWNPCSAQLSCTTLWCILEKKNISAVCIFRLGRKACSRGGIRTTAHTGLLRTFRGTQLQDSCNGKHSWVIRSLKFVLNYKRLMWKWAANKKLLEECLSKHLCLNFHFKWEQKLCLCLSGSKAAFCSPVVCRRVTTSLALKKGLLMKPHVADHSTDS